MKVCSKCKKEMHCIQNGTKVRFSADGSHVYAGDTFQCPTCKTEIVVCNTNPAYEKFPHINEQDICMDEITIIHRPRINLRKTIEEKDGRESTPDGNSEPKNEQTDGDLAYGGFAPNVQSIETLLRIFGLDHDGSALWRTTDRG